MNIPSIFETYFAHALQVFIPVFLGTLATSLQSGIQWTGAFWGAIAISAVSAALKAVFAKTTVPLLGGVKK